MLSLVNVSWGGVAGVFCAALLMAFFFQSEHVLVLAAFCGLIAGVILAVVVAAVTKTGGTARERYEPPDASGR